MLFSTDDAYAKSHRHLEDLGDIDAIAQKEVEMTFHANGDMSIGGVKLAAEEGTKTVEA